ncbi:MAG TPA: hypothetical protein VNU68_21305 [Verrucomicrobiae bacterium]|nr:hypothetical protein [Verrucomicrobiae bacterium]
MSLLDREIPWLVQHAAEGETRARPDWETVYAETSAKAVEKWLAAVGLAKYPLPMHVRVGPFAKFLRYSNGMPMMSREFLVEESKT